MKEKWVPVVDASKCTGCSRCIEVCGVKCLAIAEGIAVLTQPDACGSEEHCITACLDDAIHMAWIPIKRKEKLGIWR